MRLRIWFSLGLAVLLIHLALMQALLLYLPTVQRQPIQAFTTRAMVLAEAPMAAPERPMPPVNEQTKIRPKQAITTKPEAPPVAMAVAAEPDSRAEAPLAEAESAPEMAKAPELLKVVASAGSPPPPSREPGAAPTIQNPAFRADALPASVKLVYRVTANKFPFRLSSELLWQQHENSYAARLSISAFGQSRVQTSRGQVDSAGLAPERFSDKARSEVAAHFNRAQGTVSFSANTPHAPLLPGAQDRLSVLIQLAALVASAPQRFSPGATLRVQTVGPREADLWLFSFGEMEDLDLPGGHQRGIKLVRQPRQIYDQKLEVWLAPGLGYLPARIRITEANGDYVDQQWVASEAADKP